jgi:hypothetical protein
MEESNLPKSLDEVSVQLIFSDGGGSTVGAENVWQFYTIALLPFLLGVPPTQVTLFLAKGYMACTDEDLDGAARTCRTVLGVGTFEFFPAGYLDYLMHIHKAARDIRSLLSPSPCSLRLITGHGFSDFSGGHIKCGKTTMYFKDMQIANATVLSILDICSSAYAVAWIEGVYPRDKPRKFNSSFRKNMFRDGAAPIACEVSNATWAFRVGGFASHVQSKEDGFANLSVPFGDAVASSILLAIKTFLEQDRQGKLDEIFVDIYENRMKTNYLPDETSRPEAHAMLKHLQTLVVEGVLPVKLETFDCEFFRRCDSWYLTGERANTTLVEDQQDMAAQLIDLITNDIKEWHKEHPGSTQTFPASEKAWRTLVQCLGPYGHRLKAIALDWNEEDGNMEVADDGIELEAWAVSSSNLPLLLKQVQWTIATGSSTDPDLEDES